MNKLVVACFLLWSVTLFAQEPKPINMEVVTEREAHYPNGEMALYEKIFSSISYSTEAINAELNEQVMVSFFVLPDSTLTDFNLISKAGYGIDEQIIALLQQIKYVPAVLNGVEVKANVMLTIPITTGKGMLEKQ